MTLCQYRQFYNKEHYSDIAAFLSHTSFHWVIPALLLLWKKFWNFPLCIFFSITFIIAISVCMKLSNLSDATFVNVSFEINYRFMRFADNLKICREPFECHPAEVSSVSVVNPVDWSVLSMTGLYWRPKEDHKSVVCSWPQWREFEKVHAESGRSQNNNKALKGLPTSASQSPDPGGSVSLTTARTITAARPG